METGLNLHMNLLLSNLWEAMPGLMVRDLGLDFEGCGLIFPYHLKESKAELAHCSSDCDPVPK